MQQLKLAQAFGAMKLIADGTGTTDFESFGLTSMDAELINGDRLWLGAERQTIERLINAIVWGVEDATGGNRFPLSAEYMAAVICMFVHPVNIKKACDWMQVTYSNEDLADATPELQMTPVTASQLFGLCVEIMSSDIAQYQQRYNKRVGKNNIGVTKDEKHKTR